MNKDYSDFFGGLTGNGNNIETSAFLSSYLENVYKDVIKIHYKYELKDIKSIMHVHLLGTSDLKRPPKSFISSTDIGAGDFSHPDFKLPGFLSPDNDL